jgi:hypothetical protein
MKNFALLFITAWAIGGWPHTAFVQERTPRGVAGAEVIVWTNKETHDEGVSLMSAGVHRSNPGLVMPLIACLLPTGSKVHITDAGLSTHDIVVMTGPYIGCRGYVGVEMTR